MSLLRRLAAAPGNWSWLGFAYAAFAFYLLSPLVIVVVMSLKDGMFMGFPINAWTTRWYAEALADREFLDALFLSTWIAVVATLGATVIGIWAAVALADRRMIAASAFFALVCLPIVVPSVVQAISLRIFTRFLGIEQGAPAIVLAHTIHAVPFVALMVLTRLRAMPANLTDAARDLGADGFVAFVRVTLPFLRPALVGGTIFAMLTSFDDFVRATFLGSYAPTLPVLIYQRIHHGLSPQIAAISAMVLFVTVLLVLYAERTTRRMR
mgnify:CR=1 FL=1